MGSLELPEAAHGRNADMPDAEILAGRRFGFPSFRKNDYLPSLRDDGGAVRQREGITEDGLRKAVQGGAAIRRVVLVESAGPLFAFVRLSGQPGYCLVLLRRREGPKGFSNLRTARSMLADYGYNARILLVPQGDPFLDLIGVKLA